MTEERKDAEEYARELVNQFLPLSRGDLYDEVFNAEREANFTLNGFAKSIEFSKLYHAKECALIVCNKCIEALQGIPDIDVVGNVLLDKIEFYRGVKEEIKNIN